jgi:hypothetical protein
VSFVDCQAQTTSIRQTYLCGPRERINIDREIENVITIVKVGGIIQCKSINCNLNHQSAYGQPKGQTQEICVLILGFLSIAKGVPYKQQVGEGVVWKRPFFLKN